MASTAAGNSLPEVGAKIEGGRNVSVTPINMSDSQMTNGQFSYSSNGVRINVPSEEQRRPLIAMDDEDSNDAEVSKIDFMQHHYQVNMRTKKKRPSSSSHASAPSEMSTHSDQMPEALSLERERPMSWEGELSDSEMPVEPIQQSQVSNQQQMQQLHLQQLCNEQIHGIPGRGSEEFRLKEEFRPKEEPLDVTHNFLNHHHNQLTIGRQDNAMRHHHLQHHQRSHSMNRVSVLSGDIPDIRCPSSPQSQHKPPSICPPSLPSEQSPQSTQPLSAVSPATTLEQTIKNIPVNIIPTSLSNKMASEAHAYACKREQINSMQQVPNQQGQTILPEIKPEVPLLVDKLLGGYSLHSTPSNSPLLNRHHKIMSNPSTDSAIHSVYTHSVYSSPSASPGATRHAPYTPSLSRNNSDASHSSCYSYSSEFSPTHSPVQGRHPIPAHAAALFRSEHGAFPTSRPHHLSSVSSVCTQEGGITSGSSCAGLGVMDPGGGGTEAGSPDPEGPEDRVHHHQGVSRQQLINSPCPICGDKISGFHYGIFSCESCKGFFKRTVQNRKNYVCLRGANCLVTVATRKKCPACRFDKCLHCGMKLEAIREDRTRGGRSTYQCSYSLSGAASTSSLLGAGLSSGPLRHASSLTSVNGPSSHHSYHSQHDLHTASLGGSSHGMSLGVKSEPGHHTVHSNNMAIPPLLQEIMDVEHLWQYNESELNKLNKGQALGSGSQSSSSSAASVMNNPLLKAAGVSADSSPDFLANLCNIADHRLYKIVKWCKSLPLFKNISIDDQICLLINSWCELLVLSCCYRGVGTPGEVRVGGGSRGITLEQSSKMGLTPCIERMLHFTDHLRRLRVDRYEYVAMKVIVLLTSDISELKQPEKVRESQEKALQALQAYTLAHYPETPAKFGELLLRLPELQRTCQVGKELLNPTNKSKDGETPSFNLLMELLRGDH